MSEVSQILKLESLYNRVKFNDRLKTLDKQGRQNLKAHGNEKIIQRTKRTDMVAA